MWQVYTEAEKLAPLLSEDGLGRLMRCVRELHTYHKKGDITGVRKLLMVMDEGSWRGP